MVLNDRHSVSFSNYSTAEQREAGTTVTIDSCVPIILCGFLTDLVLEQKWQIL